MKIYCLDCKNEQNTPWHHFDSPYYTHPFRPPVTGTLTFQKLSFINKERCEDAFFPVDEWSPTDWGCAFAGEAGEACNILKKLKRLESKRNISNSGTPEIRKRLIFNALDELADTIIYADLIATRLGMSLEEAIIRKFNEVSDREGSSIKL
jgi:NTP pyrophosphatase (non-canonical NTP hydrolase)